MRLGLTQGGSQQPTRLPWRGGVCVAVPGVIGVAPTEAHPCAVAGARVHGCWVWTREPWDGSRRGPCIARGGAVLVRGAWAQSKTPLGRRAHTGSERHCQQAACVLPPCPPTVCLCLGACRGHVHCLVL